MKQLSEEERKRALSLLARHAESSGAASTPRLFQAPGRVNLLGEHTDYSGGFCMPAAISFNTLVAVSPRSDGRLRLHSLDFDATVELELDRLKPSTVKQHVWSDYCAGVAWSLTQANIRLSGANITLSGNVPLGAGLSSSASVEVATAIALLGVAGEEMPKSELAVACQRAENQFVGAPCGIMDQFISVSGVAGNALALDTRSLTAELAPIPKALRLVVSNSMVKHSVAAGGEYASVRLHVEEAADALRRADPSKLQLRDANLEDLERNQTAMSREAFLRARHVISDSRRVLEGLAALRANDTSRFGQLMVEAHESFRDDFKASCPECDILVNLALKLQGCLGARLTGGGFGGCTVSLVEEKHVDSFVVNLTAGFERHIGKTPEVYLCETAGGADERKLP